MSFDSKNKGQFKDQFAFFKKIHKSFFKKEFLAKFSFLLREDNGAYSLNENVIIESCEARSIVILLSYYFKLLVGIESFPFSKELLKIYDFYSDFTLLSLIDLHISFLNKIIFFIKKRFLDSELCVEKSSLIKIIEDTKDDLVRNKQCLLSGDIFGADKTLIFHKHGIFDAKIIDPYFLNIVKEKSLEPYFLNYFNWMLGNLLVPVVDVKAIYKIFRTKGNVALFVGAKHAFNIKKKLEALGFKLKNRWKREQLDFIDRLIEEDDFSIKRLLERALLKKGDFFLLEYLFTKNSKKTFLLEANYSSSGYKKAFKNMILDL